MDLGIQILKLLTTAGPILTVLMWSIIAGAIGVSAYFLYVYTRYNIQFRILILTKDRTLQFDDKLRKIAKKGKAVKWKLLKRREEVPPPPVDAFRITSKGKLSVTAFRTEHGQYKYVTEDINSHEKGVTNVITTEDRSFYEQQYEESKKWQHKDWTDVVRSLIPYVIILLIFIIFLAFWGKTVAPTLELSEQLIRAAELLAEAIESGQVVQLAG